MRSKAKRPSFSSRAKPFATSPSANGGDYAKIDHCSHRRLERCRLAAASSNRRPRAANIVRLDVSPSGAPFIGEATLRRAAELTLQNGDSAFRLTPIYVLAFDRFGVTVVMFRAGDPGAWDAFKAAEVLRNTRSKNSQ